MTPFSTSSIVRQNIEKLTTATNYMKIMNLNFFELIIFCFNSNILNTSIHCSVPKIWCIHFHFCKYFGSSVFFFPVSSDIPLIQKTTEMILNLVYLLIIYNIFFFILFSLLYTDIYWYIQYFVCDIFFCLR